MIDADDIHRLRTGFIVTPDDGVLPPGELFMMCAYLIRHPRGTFLWDTGIGSNPEVDAHFKPMRWPLEQLLAPLGLRLGDVKVIGNCHLHFDHAGGNNRFPDIPILAQRVEHESAATTEDYTIPGIADFPGARYELLDGDAPVWEGLRIVPTPGHTAGHQSLVVETRQGRVVLAGQSFNFASDYAKARLAQELRHAGYQTDVDYPAWMDLVEALDPWRVLFAHDVASWERGPGIPAS